MGDVVTGILDTGLGASLCDGDGAALGIDSPAGESVVKEIILYWGRPNTCRGIGHGCGAVPVSGRWWSLAGSS